MRDLLLIHVDPTVGERMPPETIEETTRAPTRVRAGRLGWAGRMPSRVNRTVGIRPVPVSC